MSTSIISNPAEFTAEQKHYLQGFFAALSQRNHVPFVGHTADGLITADPGVECSQSGRSAWRGVMVQHPCL